ncbi:DUF885 family protein [Seongchinamella sediminis]|uniref:DUF885 family protein n=1 Tax=Seongchinamella sediminis TaxID=2283635 RepID=A0A3L7DUQ3_9GAMM|nr:DUF885 domain-containing protein [Seongchinamella sediminis]RLQ21114.1 DUF885 family protein [Seongchinamella sediminis]
MARRFAAGRTFALLAAATLLAACNDEPASPAAAPPPPTPAASQHESVAALYARAGRRLFSARPVSASSYRLTLEAAGGYYANRLDDYSPAAEQALRSDMRALQRTVGATLSGQTGDSDSREVLADLAHYFAGLEAFPVGYIELWMGQSPFIVNQINGPMIDVPLALEHSHPVSSLHDAQDYLARLAAFAGFADAVIARLQADAARDWIAPAALLGGALDYLERYTAVPATEHALVRSFDARLAALDDLDGAGREALRAAAEQRVREVVYPAFARVAAAVRDLLPRARAEAGVWAQPNGDAFYRYTIRLLAESEQSPAEIHALGLAETERISGEMDRILRAQGYVEGSVGERMAVLAREPRFLFEDSTAGRQALLDYVNGEIARITARMTPWFGTAVQQAVEVRAYPRDIEDGKPGGEYQSPPADGSAPGIFWINLRDMQALPRFTLKTFIYHETNPGHHWQRALNMGQAELPLLRRIAPYNAYVEGWALYAEALAAELGMYEDDPWGDLGRLQDELLRAVRLAVDTGLHHQRWSRERAICFMAEVTGKGEAETAAEVERYMAWPGQALGYKLGMLKIQALRARAEAQLGSRFDPAAFHDQVLRGGAVPMALLERRVDAWIAALEQ